MKAVLLAGGAGTRLWPMSRTSLPKQYQKILGEKTLFEKSFKRLYPEFKLRDIYVSVIPKYVGIVKKIIPNLPLKNIILEPEKRDTAPAQGYAAARLFKESPDEPMVFIPTDHLINDKGGFLKTLRVAEKIIKKTGKMMDIGVIPEYPNTNLGYTHIGKKYKLIKGVQIYNYKGHTEKPDYETAKKYLDSGEYLWHANYYMWTPRAFLSAYKKYSPSHYFCLSKIVKALGTKKEREVIAREYVKMEKISIDYAITEKMDPSSVLILAAAFDWCDVGDWGFLKKILLNGDLRKNNVVGEHIGIETENTLIRCVSSKRRKIVATIGVKDLVIVDTEDALLVCPSDRAKEVKDVVEELKKKRRNELL